MSAAEELARLGGVASRAALLARLPRSEVDAALRNGTVVRRARGRYALPTADADLVVAHAMCGVLCLTSAALHWGWAVKQPPSRPQVTVPRNRKVSPAQATAVELHRFRLHLDDVAGSVTSRDRTLLDCLRHLPFADALAVADSALRSGHPRAQLLALARDARGTGAPRMRHVAELATPAAANPFESALRAIALRVPGLQVRPQVTIRASDRLLGRVDLADERLGIVAEADSFEWHGGREALRRDARRYNALTVDGWLVLRFTWEEVMFDPQYVEDVLRAAVAERTRVLCTTCGTAA